MHESHVDLLISRTYGARFTSVLANHYQYIRLESNQYAALAPIDMISVTPD